MSIYRQVLNKRTGTYNLVLDTALLKLKGVVDTVNDLPLSGNSENDCYVVKSNDRIYTWNKSSSTGILSDWVNVGSATEIDWNNIQNKPDSSVEEIDSAVDNSHTPNSDNQDASEVLTDETGISVQDKIDDLDGDAHIHYVTNDTDSDTSDILETGIEESYGLLIVRELTSKITGVFRIDGDVITVVSADALFTIVEDNASTYNVYWDNTTGIQQFVVQNNVGDNKDIRVGLFMI